MNWNKKAERCLKTTLFFCREVLDSFVSHCSSCGYELRGIRTANSIQELVEKIENCPSEKRLIEIIRNFPIPNTKEDILEFMVLAASNFDVKYYKSHLNEEDVSDAWLSKIKESDCRYFVGWRNCYSCTFVAGVSLIAEFCIIYSHARAYILLNSYIVAVWRGMWGGSWVSFVGNGENLAKK